MSGDAISREHNIQAGVDCWLLLVRFTARDAERCANLWFGEKRGMIELMLYTVDRGSMEGIPLERLTHQGTLTLALE